MSKEKEVWGDNSVLSTHYSVLRGTQHSVFSLRYYVFAES
jgi:hypothetical protein